MLKTCFVIPTYNHTRALMSLLDELRPLGLPCVVVDDGSDDEPQVIAQLAQREGSWLHLIRHSSNQGKGAAVMTGAHKAEELGCTHLLQIDADGQHQAQDASRFLEAASAAPEAIICGVPAFNGQVPRSRRYGRWATNIWVWINTLSFDIKDGMCGFRVYPLAPLLDLGRKMQLGSRMDFDPEVLVRLKWTGLKIINLPTLVRYPTDGRSHFKLGLDNWLISRMHARLFFSMLARMPSLISNSCAGTRRKN